MPTTLIFGGSGKIARCLTRLLVNNRHTVYSVIRNPAQTAALTALGARPIVQSIEDCTVDDVVYIVNTYRPDFVVWAAGAGGGDPARTKAVDQDGAIRVFDGLAQTMFRRLILISSIDVRAPDSPPPPWYDAADVAQSAHIWATLRGYMRAKYAADWDLRTSNVRRGIEYTILRPGRLADGPASGRAAAGKVHIGGSVLREDVALAVFECMMQRGTIGLAFDLVAGDMMMRDAVEHVVMRATDCFRPFY